MRALRKHLPSLNALYVFEAAARLGSFSRAADELGISQPAISHRIRELEDGFGIPLFRRRHRGIEVTEDGARFHADVTASLSRLLESVLSLARSARPAGSVSLCVSTALAAFWLLPRAHRLRTAHPDITLHIQTTDSEVDVAGGGFDLAIPLGHESWAEHGVHHLCRERIVPVCAPGYLEHLGGALSAETLPRATLLQLDEPYRGKRMNWSGWLHASGFDGPTPKAQLSFNDYLIVLQGALSGQGIALGWWHIVKDLIDQGLLVRAYPGDVVTERDFVILRPSASEGNQAVDRVHEWLLSEAAIIEQPTKI